MASDAERLAELEAAVAVLQAEVKAADVVGLRREVAALGAEVRAGFARMSGALWAFAAVGGLVGLAATVIGVVLALR